MGTSRSQVGHQRFCWMRVWHSAWSWLKLIVAAASVAGNTRTGMLTRLIFRNPFQVGRAAIRSPPPEDYRPNGPVPHVLRESARNDPQRSQLPTPNSQRPKGVIRCDWLKVLRIIWSRHSRPVVRGTPIGSWELGVG